MNIPAKYRFMIGTTSRVPGSRRHYLIMDFDGPIYYQQAGAIGSLAPHRSVWQRTTNGTHIYTPVQFRTLREMLTVAVDLGADPTWARIAQRRGYAFLADKCMLDIPWPVERMIVSHGKKE